MFWIRWWWEKKCVTLTDLSSAIPSFLYQIINYKAHSFPQFRREKGRYQEMIGTVWANYFVLNYDMVNQVQPQENTGEAQEKKTNQLYSQVQETGSGVHQVGAHGKDTRVLRRQKTGAREALLWI